MNKQERILGRLEKRSKLERQRRIQRVQFAQHKLMEQADEETMLDIVSEYNKRAYKQTRVYHA